MASFAAMMEMSQAQTAQKQAAVQAMAAERKRKEQEVKKRQMEQEKKRKEEEAKLRQKHFEDQKKEAEREKRREERQQAIEAERQKREEAQRDALLGKRTSSSSSSKYPSSASQARVRDEVRKKRLPSEEEDEDGLPKGEVLTRQEIRERKLQQRLKREFGEKRNSTTGSYNRPGRRLPGGAVDLTTTGRPQLTSGSGSVKQRLSALPNTLQALNQNKRDTRTIDEIVTELHANKKKTIEGEDAKGFDDWFGTKKKEQPQSRPGSSAPASGANTPKSARESSVGWILDFFKILLFVRRSRCQRFLYTDFRQHAQALCDVQADT
ncbi:hypothetical protein K435DRAFT_422147 [Dendrothele bispora CBS 962.96]|uniref:Uncharacterized protein n=1 Tax=Dendrothele bispora (strain CBS 962.96) TaxID=1314807 RepID=A0A4S8MG10_DENBC|nr:hypothetical protein K435DRAFT_422147 [Dendrothele bispora CBS 962.96]